MEPIVQKQSRFPRRIVQCALLAYAVLIAATTVISIAQGTV
ncbi:hypothetical protein WDZ92_35305 [Nostoc sp. NIES-2111]